MKRLKIKRSFPKKVLNGLKKAGTAFLKNYVLIPAAVIVGSVGMVNAQSHYGDLELTILTDNTIPAQFVNVKAIDPDLADTTTATTNTNGVAYFHAILINHDARVMQSYEVFPLSGLTTTTK